MVLHGNIDEFDADREDWASYTERLSQYFIVNGISEDAAARKRAILLRVSESVNAEPLCPSKIDRDVICRTSKTGTRSSPTPAFQFHTQVQKPEEAVGNS